MPDAALAQYRSGRSLPRELYVSREAFAADVERIWQRSWLFAGASAQVREPGDFLDVDPASPHARRMSPHMPKRGSWQILRLSPSRGCRTTSRMI